jgi:hypothetical protein
VFAPPPPCVTPQDSTVQVFEVTIRVLGGLLSAHTIATKPNGFFPEAGSGAHYGLRFPQLVAKGSFAAHG